MTNRMRVNLLHFRPQANVHGGTVGFADVEMPDFGIAVRGVVIKRVGNCLRAYLPSRSVTLNGSVLTEGTHRTRVASFYFTTQGDHFAFTAAVVAAVHAACPDIAVTTPVPNLAPGHTQGASNA